MSLLARYVTLEIRRLMIYIFFFFNDTATTEIYTLSLHDALPICSSIRVGSPARAPFPKRPPTPSEPVKIADVRVTRSEEHTSELQSPCNLVCRLLLEKKKKQQIDITSCQTQAMIAVRLIAQRSRC